MQGEDVNSLSERVTEAGPARDMDRESRRKDRKFRDLRNERARLESALPDIISDFLKESTL